MPAARRGRKRKVSSSEEEDEVSEDSLSEESEVEHSESEDEDSEDEAPRRGRGRAAAKKKPIPKKKAAPVKKKGRAAAGNKKKVIEEEEELEEELGGSSAAPAASAVNEEDENDPGFDSSLFKDEADRAYLSSLPEVERERVLAERWDRWQRYEEWKRLRAERAGSLTTTTRSSGAAAQNKNVVIDSDDEDEPKRRPVPAAAEPAQVAKAQNEEDEFETASEGDIIPPGKEDDDGNDDDDEAVDLQLINKVLLTRKQILSWIDYPAKRFRNGLTGCLVKVLLDERTERYGVRQITKVLFDGDPYVVDREVVLFMLKLKGGPRAITTRASLAKVSNKPVSESEFQMYMKESPLRDLRKFDLRQVYGRLRESLSEYVLSEKDVLLMIESRKNRHGDRSALVRAAGLTLVGRRRAIELELAEGTRERNKLAQLMEELGQSDAGDEDDDDEVTERRTMLIEKLREVNEKISQLESELSSVELKITRDAEKKSRGAVSLKLNERAENQNRETLKVVEKQKLEHATGTTVGDLNPFLRRPTRPIMMWDTSLGDSQKTAGAGSNAGQSEASHSITPATTTVQSSEHGEGVNGDDRSNDANANKFVETEFGDTKSKAVRLQLDPRAQILESTATKKFSLEEYRRMKQQKAS